MLIDNHQRQQAISPANSCLVRAPAGSGKTRLIIERILLLLHEVKHPSQILVLTFTRAATDEITQRVELALEDQYPAIDKRAKMLGWQNIPQSIQINSFDEWSAKLLHQLSDQSPPSVSSTPQIFYEEAFERFIAQDTINDNSILARILDADDKIQLTTLKTIALDLLATREQWLQSVMQNDSSWAQKQWQITKQDVFQHLYELISPKLDDLKTILHYCEQNCIELNNLHINQLQNPQQLAMIANWLLTKDGSIRKPTIRSGFESKTNASDPTLAVQMKEQYIQMTEYFQNPLILFYWQLISHNHLSSQNTEVLNLICDMLPTVLAQLKCVFKENGRCDFPEINLELLRLLQNDHSQDHPALRQTSHLLLDEFQDTSPTQFQLLGQFIKEWSLDGQSTVFIVGDPMQSIYGFRSADVRLFLQLQESKHFHHIPIKTLALSANFRSSPQIIKSINQILPKACLNQSILNWCAIPYHPSVAMQSHSGKCSIIEVEPALQAQILLDELVISENETSAILVRTRSQGQLIQAVLNEANITCDSRSLDNLLDDPLCHDLLCLFAAICRPECNIAWAALTQSLWLQVTYEFLHLHHKPGSPILSTLISQQKQLKPCAQLFLDLYFASEHLPIYQQFYFMIEKLNTSIHDKASVLLEHIESTPSDFAYLPDLINQFQSIKMPISEPGNLQMMTIHQSKGLEFDHVHIPFAWENTSKSHVKILTWDSWIPQNSSIPCPLIAQTLSTSTESAWLELIKKKKTLEEQKRLLYVAISRAKTTLTIYTAKKYRHSSFQDLMGGEH